MKEHEDALEFAMKLQLSYDLPEDKRIIKHWGNYVSFCLKHIKSLKENGN